MRDLILDTLQGFCVLLIIAGILGGITLLLALGVLAYEWSHTAGWVYTTIIASAIVGKTVSEF